MKFLKGRPTKGQRGDAIARGDPPFTKTEWRRWRKFMAKRDSATPDYETALAECWAAYSGG